MEKTGKSIVYFTDFRCTDAENLPQKFLRLLSVAGLHELGLKEKFVAIKMHFGEPGCLAYLRPNWAMALAKFVKECGGHPFLTDANTLYVGRRKNAVEHLCAAAENGFSPYSTGCQIIIADGLKGLSDVAVPVPDGKYVKEAYIARAIYDADAIISLNHFKCHEMTGIGGALKNLGMGCASRAGKKILHSSIRPTVDKDRCIGCGKCVQQCAHAACVLKDRKAFIDTGKCAGCGRCIGACNRDAIQSDFGVPCTEMHGKIAEYAAAVVRGKPAFHISFICDVSPHCDCHAMNDQPLVPDVGIAVSADPVALDHACADLVNAAPILPGSALDGVDVKGDVFTSMHPATRWRDVLEEGERMRLGTPDYELRSL